MGDGWSLDKSLIPSDGVTCHPDPRMHLKLKNMPARERTMDFIKLALERDGKGALPPEGER